MGADGLREESSFMIASNRNHQKSPARLSTTPASYFSSDNEEQLNQKTGPSVVSPLGVEIDPSTSCIQKSTPSSAKSMRLDFSHMRVGNDSAIEEFLGFCGTSLAANCDNRQHVNVIRDFNAPAIVSPGSDTFTDGSPPSSSSTAVCRNILAEIKDQIAAIAEDMRLTVSLKVCAESVAREKESPFWRGKLS